MLRACKKKKKTSNFLVKLLLKCATVVIRLVSGWASSWVTHSLWDSMSILILTSSIQAYVIISINLYRHALAELMIQANCQKRWRAKRRAEKRDSQETKAILLNKWEYLKLFLHLKPLPTSICLGVKLVQTRWNWRTSCMPLLLNTPCIILCNLWY